MTNFYWFALHLVIGIWLIASPYALNFTDTAGAFWNTVIAGAVFVISSAFGMYSSREEVAGGQAHRKAA